MISAHDIVSINQADLKGLELPEWYEKSDKIYGTVRRAKSINDGYIPLGLRGKQRNQRFAFEVPAAIIQEIFHPFEIINRDSFRTEEVKNYEVYKQYLTAQEMLSEIKWGVGGSLGFELVTGEPTIKSTSDFDLLIYANAANELPKEIIEEHSEFFEMLDTQVITKRGGFALKEYLINQTGKILLKTDEGPLLTTQIW